MRATLGTALREEDFAVAIPLAERWTAGVAGVIDGARPALDRAAARLPRRVLVLARRAPAPADGAEAAAAIDAELDAYLHLSALEPRRAAAPFHNMALFPSHTAADVDRHTAAFASGRRDRRDRYRLNAPGTLSRAVRCDPLRSVRADEAAAERPGKAWTRTLR